MSTEAIIVLAAVVVLAIVAWLAMQRLSGTKRRERAIGERREHAVAQEQSLAQERVERAERAEQHAREERAAAEQHQARAELHEAGHLDHEHEAALEVDRDPDAHAADRGEREPLTSEGGTEIESTGRFSRDGTDPVTSPPSEAERRS